MRKEYDMRGAQRGAVVKETGKLRITIMLDSDTLAGFRQQANGTGHGYQTLINRALREHLANNELEERLRRVLREERHNLPEALPITRGTKSKPINLGKHKAVLEEWQARSHHATETFVSDGPIDPKRWSKIERRVLFLAKEAHGKTETGGHWDLPTLVREEWKKPKYKLWWTLGYWAYGIQRLASGPIPSSPWTGGQHWKDEVRESVLASAVVNIKKSDGRSSSNDNDLREHVYRDWDLIKQQVECLSPHVIVCCNTWPLVKERVWPHAQQISELVHSIDGILVLDFWHPASLFPNVMNYYTVVTLVHRALFRQHDDIEGGQQSL